MEDNKGTFYLKKPNIFSFAECLHFLDRNYDDCLYSIEDDRVIKPLLIDGEPTLFQITDTSDKLKIKQVEGEHSKAIVNEAGRYVTEWFDLERNLHPFYQLLQNHDPLSPMTETYYGLRLLRIPDLFEALCWCVVGQQINLTFAHKLKRQLVEAYGTFITYESKRHYFFPEAGVLAGLAVDDLKELQFSRQKAEYIIGIAKDVADGSLKKQELIAFDETSKMLKRLRKIRGVGDWTANYVLMKSLGRTDCITHGDTGLQSAVSKILGLERKPTRNEVEAFFEPFAGWESYLNMYLWRSLSG